MLVSFIIIALNAEKTLPSLLDDLRKQSYPHDKIELILVDGQSTDTTKQLMLAFAEQIDFARVLVLDNTQKILPCGWNIALSHAAGDIILRVDAHASIPSNFIWNNVKNFKQGEKIVGGPRTSIVDETDDWQKTLLVVESSLFGSGIAYYRRSKTQKYVSTLAHGAYAREVFECVGGYDERCVRTEDNEMHCRMRQAGFRLFFDPSVRSFHHARNSFGKMCKQKFLNGKWIGLTMGISPRCFSLYHFAPLAFVLAILGTTVLGVLGIWAFSIALWTCYGLTALILSITSVIREPFCVQFLALPFLFLALHLSYGAGALLGLLKLPIWLRTHKTCENIERVKQTMLQNRRDT